MSGHIDFYFDYSSPFGYLASERIEPIASRHNRTVVWHPILLGVIFKVSKQVPLTQAPLKGDYSIKDFSRSAREHSLAYKHPDVFPIGAVAACRATLWVRNHVDEAVSGHTQAFIQAVYRAYFSQGQDITNVDVLAELANKLGLNPGEMIEALGDQSIKDALRQEVEMATNRGVFGSPMMIVDGEPFWGHDRLEQMDRWLETGGW